MIGLFKLPGLPGFIIRSWAIGAAIGMGLASGLLLTDAGGLRSLLSQNANPFAALFLLAGGFSTLFGGLYAATAIMLLPSEAPPGDVTGKPQ